MAHKVYLAIVWHQHQPFYKNLKTGQAIMPWVRLHATKDYYDMAAILDDFPKIRLTINLVPSLVVQLQDFAEGRCTDPWLEKTLIPAAKLTDQDKIWILENFFFCNWDTMIYPWPRYAELFDKRGKFSTGKELERIRNYFNPQDFLDLQVWFNLAWMDPFWQEKDPLISHLYKKGNHFSETEKTMLIEKQKEICKSTIEKHKELWHKGQIEVSTTPFYHPILPLLCDTDSAQMAMPNSLRPKNRFQHPEDAKLQIEKALQFMEALFGKRPVGMWPSEGSVSEAAASLLSQSGIRWAATDEEIYFKSSWLDGKPYSRESLYQPHKIGQQSLQMVFRDHALSDAVGFVYARMDPKRAVEDFIGRICKIADSIPNSTHPPLVSVILDGENCWEFYKRDGQEFLKTLYAALSDHPRIETTTLENFIEKYPAKNTLNKLWSGSWIGANFAIWIGHPEDNQAWDSLTQAREFLVETIKNHPEKSDDPSTRMAWESLYVAEGSDWCWWYGDQNSTAQDAVFDELFRDHLKNVYTFMGCEAPHKLKIPIKTKQRKSQAVSPMDLISPRIDGLVTNYFEWRSAGHLQVEGASGTMHQAENNWISAVYYGFDLENLYLRIDPKKPLEKSALNEINIKIIFMEPAECNIMLRWEKDIMQAVFTDKQQKQTLLSKFASKKIIELSVPFSLLAVQENEPVEYVVSVIKNGNEIEHCPHQATIQFKRPTKEFGSDLWSV